MTPLQGQILQLYTKGLNHAQIAERTGCTPRYVRKTIQTVRAGERKLTLPNYFEAVRRGINTQKQLAAWFGVSDRTIRNFEKRYNVNEIGIAYSDFLKTDYLANLEKELIDISEMLKMCNPDSPTLEKIDRLIKVLKFDFLTNPQKQK